MNEGNAFSTPIISGSIIYVFWSDSFPAVHLYRRIVGALQYVTVTRSEIAYVVNKVSQFMHVPMMNHQYARILLYLLVDIFFRKPSDFSLRDFVDSNWASDLDDHRSMSKYCIQFGGNLISWTFKKQIAVSSLSTKVEYKSVAHVFYLVWIQHLHSYLRISLPFMV